MERSIDIRGILMLVQIRFGTELWGEDQKNDCFSNILFIKITLPCNIQVVSCKN